MEQLQLEHADRFSEYKSSSDAESQFTAAASGSTAMIVPGFMSLAMVTASFSSNASGSSKTSGTSHIVTASMTLERYYSSVREEISPLADDAKQLLDSQDYVGFFKACGPNYVRGIRRMQEVTAMFNYKTSSKETASQFAASMKVSVRSIGITGYAAADVSSSFSRKSKFKSASSSMTISIKGWGVGLSEKGAETFVATSLETYQQVMKFAFKAMTRGENAAYIGMVYGIEVVPWVHNTAFQVAAKLAEEVIEIPMPRSLIPKAIPKLATNTAAWTNATRDDFTCKEPTFNQDKYGYCCELEQMFDTVNNTYSFQYLYRSVCKPVRQLDPSLVKDNMSNNGEFVTRMDGAMRYKLAQLSTLEKCISAANSIPETFDHHELIPQDTVKYDKVISTPISLLELRLAIDPKGDYSVLKHMGKEIDEWVQMYMSPCYMALFGTNVGVTPDVEATFFMAYPWWHHDECMHLSCMTNNMRWDRKNKGCVPSVINGAFAANYTNDDAHCARDDDDTTNNGCKHQSANLKLFRDNVVTCWSQLEVKSVEYIMSHYCMPQVTGKLVSAARQASTTGYKTACEAPIAGLQSY